MRAPVLVVLLLLTLAPSLVRGETPANLDARGRQLYELLMNYPPSKKENLSFIKEYSFEFVRVSGHPRYQKFQTSLALADVVYEFKPFKSSKENKIRFLIYADAAAAKRYIEGEIPRFLLDGPAGSNSSVIAPADTIFKRPQHYVFGVLQDGRTAWLRWAYQVDRLVIVGVTDMDIPPQKDALNPDLSKVPDEIFSRGFYLAAIGKLAVGQRVFNIAEE